MPGVHGSQERVLDLELEMVVRYHIGAGNRTRALAEKQSVLLSHMVILCV